MILLSLKTSASFISSQCIMSIYTNSLCHQSLFSGGQTERQPIKHDNYDYQTPHFTRNWQSTWEESAGEAKRRHGLSKAVFSATPFRAVEDPKPGSILDTEEAKGSEKSKCHIPINLREARHGSRADCRAWLQAFRKEVFSGKTALVFQRSF